MFNLNMLCLMFVCLYVVKVKKKYIHNHFIQFSRTISRFIIEFDDNSQVGTEWVTKGQNIDQSYQSVAGIARGLYGRS